MLIFYVVIFGGGLVGLCLVVYFVVVGVWVLFFVCESLVGKLQGWLFEVLGLLGDYVIFVGKIMVFDVSQFSEDVFVSDMFMLIIKVYDVVVVFKFFVDCG